jgi:gamma-glutamyltranspeptidase/glutathione hydrolase
MIVGTPTSISSGRPLGPSVFPPPESLRPTLRGTHGLVVAGNPLAAQVAAAVLEAGGNAIDAGVSGSLALTVVQPDMCSFGGIAPIVFRRAGEQTVHSVAGVGTWSASASIDAFRARHGDTMLPGVASTVVPAAPAAFIAALRAAGTWRFHETAAMAIDLAANGFPVDPTLAAGLDFFGEVFKQWSSTTDVYWTDEAPVPTGSLLRQPDLAAVLSELAAADARKLDRASGLTAAHRAFYEGRIAETMVDFVTAGGGFLTLEDMATFSADIAETPSRRYRDMVVHAPDGWSQGPLLLQALAILETFDLAALAPGSADLLHLITEAITLAAGDRERYYGDPDFVDVPLEWLLSDEHAKEQAAQITPDGSLPNVAGFTGDAIRSTTHLSVVDAAGNAFSTAPSDTLSLAPVVPGLGFIVSPRGIQSRLDPGHPASLEPGKRPRVTPAPVIAFDRDGCPWALSCPGGDVILQAILQVIVSAVDHSMTPQQAVEAPRICALTFPNSFHPHQQIDGQLCVEGRIDEAVRVDLETRGHHVQDWPDWEFDAGSVALVRALPNGTLEAGADPRRAAHAAGR